MEKEAKIQLRLPLQLRDWFRVFAAKHDRSMNGQIVAMLREQKEAEEKQGVAA
jgi:hypothetical protein